jgi:putative ABC transport system substrate-binding protein
MAGGLLAAPLTAEGQQTGKVYRIGVLANEPSPMWEALRQRLKELGYVEGQNIAFEYRWSAGQVERFPSLAAELVGLKVDVIVTGTRQLALSSAQRRRFLSSWQRVEILLEPDLSQASPILGGTSLG